MIKGERIKKLTIDNVLSLISPFDIFRFYIPDKTWKINQAFNSPFRKDSNPSFMIGSKYGTLHYIDYGNTEFRGDCFQFVKQLFGLCSIDEVLKLIDKEFGLGISYTNGNTGEYKKIVSEYKQPEELGKRYCLIQVVTRKFTQEELNYWLEYYQTIEDLRANNIYSIKELYFNKKKYPIKEDDLRFGYLYEGGWWKIYFPMGDKKNKWRCNVPLTTTYGLNNLRKDRNTLITKSLKDYLVCRKVYEHVCHVQNESLAAFSEETVEYINKHSNQVFYGGDSDSAGKDASYAITKAFGWKHINPPDYLLTHKCKDFACLGKLEGLEKLKEHFTKKGLIKIENYKKALYY